MLDHVNNLRRQGMPRSSAILLGCRERFRPILMIAITTIVGLIPLALGTSGIFELRYFPLARTVMGGLAASTVLRCELNRGLEAFPHHPRPGDEYHLRLDHPA